MSATVKLSSKLPGDEEVNGLDGWAEWMEENPEELICAVVWIDTPRVTIDTETRSHVPTARIRRIEPLGAMADVSPAVRKAVDEAMQERTGRTPLPFEIATAGTSADPDGDPLPEGE